MNNSEYAVEEPNERDPRREAALEFAIAEARYHREFQKVNTHELELGSAQQVANHLLSDIDLVLGGMPKTYSEGPPNPVELEYVNFAVKQLEWLFVKARRGRRKALKAWCAFNRRENLNSQS